MTHQPAGPEITSDSERLYRQVHPKWVDEAGRISSQAFEVFDKDEGLLSVHQGSKVGSAKEAFDRFILNRNVMRSHGVAVVTRAECHVLQLPAFEDPIPEGDPNRPTDDAHAVISFRLHVAGAQQRNRWKKLRDAAQVNGWQYLDKVAS
jgi:hypothetical protein